MKKKQFVVIGLGRFGRSVAITLSSMGYDVLAIDSHEEEVQAIASEVTHAVQADARDEQTLRALGIRNFDVAIVAIGDDVQSNILVTVLLKEIGIKYVLAKAKDNLHGKVLEKVGADRVIYPEKDMGIRVAHHLVSPSIIDFIKLSPDYNVIEVSPPPEFIGKTLRKLNLRAHYGLSVIAIKKENTIIGDPGADSLIEENDILVLIGNTETLNHLFMKE